VFSGGVANVRFSSNDLPCLAFSVARWEHLQRDKEELERRFRSELRGLRSRQQGELEALEEGLRARHADECLRLQEEQQQEVEELRASQQEEVGGDIFRIGPMGNTQRIHRPMTSMPRVDDHFVHLYDENFTFSCG